MISNKKIKRIRKLPEGNNIILIWVFLIAEAGKCNKGGGLYLTDLIPFNIEDLAIEFDFEKDVIRLALSVLEKYEMIEIFEDVIYIKNWEKYQNIDGLEKIREQTRKRVQSYRQKQLCNVTCNATVTQGNATDIDKEIDKEINNSLLEKTPNKSKSKIKKVFSNEDKEYLLSNYLSKQITKRLEVPLKDESTLQKWSVEFERMVRIDGYDVDEIKDVLVFSQRDLFWQTVILSASKFRKQYLALLGKMKQAGD